MEKPFQFHGVAAYRTCVFITHHVVYIDFDPFVHRPEKLHSFHRSGEEARTVSHNIVAVAGRIEGDIHHLYRSAGEIGSPFRQ